MNIIMYEPYERLGGIYLYFAHNMTDGLSNHMIRMDSDNTCVCTKETALTSIYPSHTNAPAVLYIVALIVEGGGGPRPVFH